MSLLLKKIKEIKEGLSSIKDKDSVTHVYERIVDLVSKEYPTTSNYSKKLRSMDFDIKYPSTTAKNVKNIDNLLQIIIDDLELKYNKPIIEKFSPWAKKLAIDLEQITTVKKKVFIVHGHNETKRCKVY